ncbi:hypothetical protein K5X82_13085 [Halosquirtibacter xylanolyticus]|uniref:DUF7017 domain-containing protein n=1 Tax=Halosquirtibacter xylanolyticus TaxID=3374599 RepID=UPI00374821B0|nr:hypothetical protein K5X82_13085 [Prolixibacteraceae bacterium]
MSRSLDIDKAREAKDWKRVAEIISNLTKEEKRDDHVKNSVAMACLDQMKESHIDVPSFISILQRVSSWQLVSAHLPTSSETVTALVDYVSTLSSLKLQNPILSVLKQIFRELSQWDYVWDEGEVERLIQEFYLIGKRNPAVFFIDVLDWWEQQGVSKTSQEVSLMKGFYIRALYERFYVLCSCAFLQSGQFNGPKGEQWQDRIYQLLLSFPQFKEIGLSLFLLNEKRDELEYGISLMKEFVHKNIGLYWGWELMAKYHQQLDHSETVLACLCRAYQCNMSPITKYDIGLQIAYRIAEHSGDNVASWMAHLLIQNKSREVKCDQGIMLSNLMHKALPCSSKVANEVINQWAHVAERWLWSDFPSFVGVVSWIDHKAKVVGVVYGVSQKVVIPFSRIEFEVEVGTWLRVILKEKEDMNPDLLYVELSKTLPSGSIFKTISGRVQQKVGEPFGFVSDCFIPPFMMTKNSLEQGEWVELSLVYDIDKRLDKMVWKVVTVEKIERPR